MKTNATKANGGDAAAFFSRIWHLAVMALLFSPPAFAQFQQSVQSKLSAMQMVLIGVSGTTATIAGAYVGNKMMFGQAKWPEVSHVAIGGTIVSVAAAFGAFIVG